MIPRKERPSTDRFVIKTGDVIKSGWKDFGKGVWILGYAWNRYIKQKPKRSFRQMLLLSVVDRIVNNLDYRHQQHGVSLDFAKVQNATPGDGWTMPANMLRKVLRCTREQLFNIVDALGAVDPEQPEQSPLLTCSRLDEDKLKLTTPVRGDEKTVLLISTDVLEALDSGALKSESSAVLYALICRHEDANTSGLAYPGDKHLANELGVLPRMVQVSLLELAKAGFIQKSKLERPGRRTCRLLHPVRNAYLRKQNLEEEKDRRDQERLKASPGRKATEETAKIQNEKRQAALARRSGAGFFDV